MIKDPSFEDALVPASTNAPHVIPDIFPGHSSVADLGIWQISSGGVGLVANNGRPQTPLLPVYWPSTDCASCAACPGGVWCKDAGLPSDYWNTPDGYQFIALGVSDTGTNFAATTVYQNVNLTIGSYKLSFLQSAYNHVDSRDQIDGRVRVQILSPDKKDVLLDPASHLPPIFTVSGGTNWVTQSTTFHISVKSNYTIQFSTVLTTNTYGGYAALIDAVSLVK